MCVCIYNNELNTVDYSMAKRGNVAYVLCVYR